MKFNFITFVGLAVLLLACHTPGNKKEANRLADQAMKTFMPHTLNIDSTTLALHLLDSAIKLYPSPNIYFGKFQIYKVENDQLAALRICDTVLMLYRNNFAFTLEKGCAFEKLGNFDSAFRYYRVALRMIDNPHSFNATEIVKDYEKIVITALLTDTAGFNRLVNQFRIKYRGSKDALFQTYSDEFDHFKRENYVN
jgi:tetratricopeptide (TPR) repeat protein